MPTNLGSPGAFEDDGPGEPEVKKRKAKTFLWPPDRGAWKGPYKTLELAEAELTIIMVTYCNSRSELLTWKCEIWTVRKGDCFGSRQLRRCPFHTSTGCEFRVRIEKTEEGEYFIVIGGWAHDHTGPNQLKRRNIKNDAFLSPSKLAMHGSVMWTAAYDDHGISPSVENKAKMFARHAQARKESKRAAGADPSDEGSWGELTEAVMASK